MVTAAKAALLSFILPTTSPCWEQAPLLCHSEKEIIINAFRVPPAYALQSFPSNRYLGPKHRVDGVSHEERGTCMGGCSYLSTKGLIN